MQTKVETAVHHAMISTQNDKGEIGVHFIRCHVHLSEDFKTINRFHPIFRMEGTARCACVIRVVLMGYVVRH